MIDHDRLFKELLSTFFVEFIDLFFPEVREYLDASEMTFLDKEVFTDVTEGEKHETDLIAQVKFRNQPSCFLIHVEAQASSRPNFNQRMFCYFARLHEKFSLPIYPIVVFSYETPQKKASSQYQVEFPDFKVLTFNYQVVQLNQLNWRDFLSQSNPVASALMAKMQIAPEDRAKVKAQCLRLLVTLKLDPARMQLISGFIDTYLPLNDLEETVFQSQLKTFQPQEQEDVMQIVTTWMAQGIEQGVEQGITREKDLIVRLIKKKLGNISPEIETQVRELDIEQIEALGEDLLDFSTVEDLQAWLLS